MSTRRLFLLQTEACVERIHVHSNGSIDTTTLLLQKQQSYNMVLAQNVIQTG